LNRLDGARPARLGRVVEARTPYELLSDADLKREVDDLVRAWHAAQPAERPALERDAEVLREEVRKRLRGRGGGEEGGVREPRRPRPGGSAGAVTADP
jgi:hypothetical protein